MKRKTHIIIFSIAVLSVLGAVTAIGCSTSVIFIKGAHNTSSGSTDAQVKIDSVDILDRSTKKIRREKK